MIRLLSLLLIFCTVEMTSAADFTFGNQVLKVPDGYEVERIAGPPLVSRPISAAFDEQGRLYVTESSGNSGNANEQRKNPLHQILRLEDTDGDGKFDKKTVFAEKVMFPEGCMWLDGSLYVSAVPEILKFTDTDGDGVSDKREVWHDGKTVGGCANDLHGPYLGRDGWIYWCKGAWGQQSYERPGKNPLTTRAAHIFRARPDHSQIEYVLTGGMDNPVGVAFAPNGERFLSCTFYEPYSGKRDGLIHAIYGGVYGKIHESTNEHKQTGDLMPGLTHMGAAAPCGMIYWESRENNATSANLLACYFNLHKVGRHELQPSGSTYTTRDSDFISCTQVDFHPTDVLEDADGSIIVVDTGGWYKVCCPTSQIAKPDIFGAIYRIRKTGTPKVEDPRGLKMKWDTLSCANLAALLADPRHNVRQRAIRELGKKGTDAVTELQKIVAGDKDQSVDLKQNAVWALARIDGELARAVTCSALKAGVPAAIHACGLWRDISAIAPLEKIVEESADAGLARAAAEALGRIGDKRAVPALLATARKLKVTESSNSGAPVDDAQRILEHSLIYALIEIADPAGTSSGLGSQNTQIKRAALVALDQMDGGALTVEHVAPLLSSADPILKRTATWIVGHHSEWGGTLANHYRERIENPPATPQERADLISQLAHLAKSAPMQELLAKALEKGDASAELALAAMTQAGLREIPLAWNELLVRKLAQNDAKLLPDLLAAAESFPTPKAGNPLLSAALKNVAQNKETRADLRLRAFAASGKPGTIEMDIFDLLAAHINPSISPNLRALAASVLAKAELSPTQQLAIANVLKQVSPLDLPLLLQAFSRGGDEAAGMKLVSALDGSAGLRSLRPDALKAIFAKYPQSVQDAGAKLIESLAADAAKQAARLEELMGKMKGGNAERGKVVFSTKGTCINCHTKGGIGVNFGPDLTTVNQVRTERDLLESIIFPSATFVRSFEPFTVFTSSGELFTGLLRKDAPDEVIIATNAQTEKRIARADIKKMRADTLSVMPQGFDQILTPEEIADVIAFLKSK